MSNILDIDLNDIVSKEISARFQELEETVNLLNKQLREKTQELSLLQQELEKSKLPIALINGIRKSYSEITNTSDDRYNSNLYQNQFEYLAKILKSLSGKQKEVKWHRGGLKYNLALNFREEKDIVNAILPMILDKKEDIDFITSFKMPYEWDKETILKFVKNPHSCTNGEYFGIGEYWIREGLGLKNAPYDLILANPHVLEEDVFQELINTIRDNKYTGHVFFTLPKHNKGVSLDQIQQMAECLITYPTHYYRYDIIEGFIKNNLSSFNKPTLDHLSKFISYDNQFRVFHWENFPFEYQKVYLLGLSFKSLLVVTTSYSCKWSDEEKQEMYKSWFEANSPSEEL